MDAPMKQTKQYGLVVQVEQREYRPGFVHYPSLRRPPLRRGLTRKIVVQSHSSPLWSFSFRRDSRLSAGTATETRNKRCKSDVKES